MLTPWKDNKAECEGSAQDGSSNIKWIKNTESLPGRSAEIGWQWFTSLGSRDAHLTNRPSERLTDRLTRKTVYRMWRHVLMHLIIWRKKLGSIWLKRGWYLRIFSIRHRIHAIVRSKSAERNGKDYESHKPDNGLCMQATKLWSTELTRGGLWAFKLTGPRGCSRACWGGLSSKHLPDSTNNWL